MSRGTHSHRVCVFSQATGQCFGSGFIRFPGSTEGVCAVRRLCVAVKRINAFGVHFDFKPGATLAALFSRHPDLQHMYSAPITQSELSAEVVCRGLVYASLLELMACPLVVVQDGSHGTDSSGSAGRSVTTGAEFIPFTATTPHYVADLAWSWPIESQAMPRDQHFSQSPPMSWPPAAPPPVSHQQATRIN